MIVATFEVKRFALAAGMFLSLLPVAAAAADSVFVGSWNGLALQRFSDGKFETWTVALHIDADGNGRIDYPTLNCGGTLTPLRTTARIAEYRERLTYGKRRCVNLGTVGLIPRAGRLIWYWLGNNTSEPELDTATMLHRTN